MSEMWIQRWFNSDYYHILYENRNDDEAGDFIENLMSFINLPKGSAIIDIACGRGRHAHYLNKKGFNVTGIDIAQRNIDYARKHEGQQLHFECHDKRKVFEANKYDLALNLFTSFGYLKSKTELSKTLNNMAQNLKVGGLLVMDYLNATKIEKMSFDNEIQLHQSIEFKIKKHIEEGRIVKEIEVFDGLKREKYSEKVRLISKEEFIIMFEDASLKILYTFGDYDLTDFDPEGSDRLILIAEKL